MGSDHPLPLTIVVYCDLCGGLRSSVPLTISFKSATLYTFTCDVLWLLPPSCWTVNRVNGSEAFENFIKDTLRDSTWAGVDSVPNGFGCIRLQTLKNFLSFAETLSSMRVRFGPSKTKFISFYQRILTLSLFSDSKTQAFAECLTHINPILNSMSTPSSHVPLFSFPPTVVVYSAISEFTRSSAC